MFICFLMLIKTILSVLGLFYDIIVTPIWVLIDGHCNKTITTRLDHRANYRSASRAPQYRLQPFLVRRLRVEEVLFRWWRTIVYSNNNIVITTASDDDVRIGRGAAQETSAVGAWLMAKSVCAKWGWGGCTGGEVCWPGGGGGLETSRDDKTNNNYYLADDHARYMRIIILDVCGHYIIIIILNWRRGRSTRPRDGRLRRPQRVPPHRILLQLVLLRLPTTDYARRWWRWPIDKAGGGGGVVRVTSPGGTRFAWVFPLKRCAVILLSL